MIRSLLAKLQRRKWNNGELSRLQLSNGDILLVRLPDGTPYAEQVDVAINVRQVLNHLELEGVGVLIIGKSDDLQRISEKTMNVLGWYRR
jgi:hypothetical protein